MNDVFVTCYFFVIFALCKNKKDCISLTYSSTINVTNTKKKRRRKDNYMKRKLFLCLGAVFSLFIGIAIPNKAFAADTHTITYKDVYGMDISTEQVSDGSTINLPAESDVLAWLYDECRMATSSVVPTKDMTITAVYNSDVTANGTLDNGNIVWFIYDTKLYVTGNGTISLLDKYSTGTKKYGFAVSSFSAEQPSVSADFKTEQTLGDEKTTGWGEITIPATERTVELNVSRPISFAGATVGAPATDIASVTPWSAYDADITEMYFSDDISLSGNMTFFFNLNSESLQPTSIKESVFTKLTTIYMYADTSNVTRMGGMYARIPSLTQIFVRDGEVYDMSSVTDVAAMCYGDEALLCGFSNSLLNSLYGFGNVKDARYMLFGCKSLHQPNFKDLDVSSVEDASFMFAGCNDLGLLCDPSDNTKKYNIGKWNLENVYSTAFMFAGSKIDYSSPSSNFWGSSDEGFAVITGDVSVDALNLVKDQVTVYMFANNKNITSFTMTSAMPVLQDASGMAAWCKNMNNVDMQGFSAPQLTYAIAMFFNSGIDGETLVLKDASFPVLTDTRYMFYASGYRKIDFSETNLVVLTNTQGMFASCKRLNSLGNNALGGWHLAQVTDASYMFSKDELLSSVNTTNWGMDAVVDISHIFEDCVSLSSVSVASWNVGALTNIEGAFYNSGIVSFPASSWNTCSLKNAFMAFADCLNLSTVNISGWNLDVLETSSGMFMNDVNLANISVTNEAPCLKDCSAMFLGCTGLTTANIPKLITSTTTNAAYLFDGDVSLTSVDASNWNTSAVVFAQAMYRDCEKLSTLTSGSGASYEMLQDAGCMYKNCKRLPSDTVQAAINRMNPVALKNMYESFYGVELLQSIDLSGMSVSSVTDMTRMLYQEENNLSAIIVSSDFASGITDMSVNGKNIFSVGHDTVTDFTVKGSIIPTNIKNYDWTEDHRIFLKDKGSYINDVNRTTYFFTTDADETAVMKAEIESTFKLQNTALPISYSWKNGTSTLTATTNSYSSQEAGTYVVEATLNDLKNVREVKKTFYLVQADYISSITAEYTGNPVPIGDNYNKEDLLVKAYQNSTDTYTLLSTDDYDVDSLKVTKVGDNTYTVTYIDPENQTFTAEFVVPGKRVIGEIKAVYSGPVIWVGNNYDTANVTLTAYYADDTDKEEGFEVEASRFSGIKVENRGNNTFLAYYTDKSNNNKELEASFGVKGYLPVNAITAEYGGPSIVVGNNYNKSDVVVTLHFDDDITDQTATDFSVDSLSVTQIGDNSYVATFIDEYGTEFTDSFLVIGVINDNSSDSEDAAEDVTNEEGDTRTSDIYEGTGELEQPDTSNVTGTGVVKTGDSQNLIAWIFLAIIMFVLIIVCVIYVVKVRKK